MLFRHPSADSSPSLLETDVASVKRVLGAWGPGKFDAELLMDGKGFRPDGKTAATLIPPAFGLAGGGESCVLVCITPSDLSGA
jgi:hypothetical protein